MIGSRSAHALAVLTGLLLFFSFPKFGAPAAGWLAAAPLLVAVHSTSGRDAFRLGLLAGFVANLGIYYWTAAVVSEFGGIGLAVSTPLMALMSLIIALFTAAFAWIVSRLSRAWGAIALLLAPLVWVALEILRSHILLRFAWCLLGYSQSSNLPFLQVARLGGVYAVSFVLVAGSAALAYAVVEPSPRHRLRILACLIGLLGIVYWDGRQALSKTPPADGTVRVGVIQANIAQDVKWDPGLADRHLGKHMELTRDAVRRGARFVVWPESAVPGFYDDSPYLVDLLGELARTSSTYLLFGNDDHTVGPDGSERYYVGAKMLRPDGALGFRYHKINLVPFGEYVPLQPVLTLGGRFTARLTQAVSDFTPGEERSIGEVDGHRFGALICYEAIYPDLVSEFVGAGAELLVNITNDAWYGWTSAPYQHFEMARVRAVETGKYLVRAANTGISAVVDPRGAVVARTKLFEPAVLVVDVPFVSATTLYARTGDLFAWSCFGVTAVLLGLSYRRGRIQ